jgi:hypothetical protein
MNLRLRILLISCLFDVITITAMAIVFIRLSCEGSGCLNATEWQNMTVHHKSAYESFMDLWSFG